MLPALRFSIVDPPQITTLNFRADCQPRSVCRRPRQRAPAPQASAFRAQTNKLRGDALTRALWDCRSISGYGGRLRGRDGWPA
jgi:hypothetical protein